MHEASAYKEGHLPPSRLLKLVVNRESVPKWRRHRDPFHSIGSFSPLALTRWAEHNGSGEGHYCGLLVGWLSVIDASSVYHFASIKPACART